MIGWENFNKKCGLILSINLGIPCSNFGIDDILDKELIDEMTELENQCRIKRKILPYFNYLLFKMIKHSLGSRYSEFKSIRRHYKNLYNIKKKRNSK